MQRAIKRYMEWLLESVNTSIVVTDNGVATWQGLRGTIVVGVLEST